MNIKIRYIYNNVLRKIVGQSTYTTNYTSINISFKVEKDTIHGLVGPNGAGKSITMKIYVDIISFIRIDYKYFYKKPILNSSLNFY